MAVRKTAMTAVVSRNVEPNVLPIIRKAATSTAISIAPPTKTARRMADLSAAGTRRRLHRFPGVAIGARHRGEVAEVDGVREILLRHREHRRPRLGLPEEIVADMAVLGDHLPVLRHVLVVVAAEATFEIEVPDVVGVRAPVDLHLREARAAEDVLRGGDGAVDRGALAGIHGGVLLAPERAELARDRVDRL